MLQLTPFLVWNEALWEGKETNVPIFYPTVHHFYPFSSSQYITWKSTAYAILLFVDCYNCPQFPLFHTFFFSAHTGQNIHSTHNKGQQNRSNSKIHSIKRKTKIEKDKNLSLVYIKPRYPSKMTFNYIDFTWWGNLRL